MNKLFSDEEEILLIAILTISLSQLAPPLQDKKSFLAASNMRRKLMAKFGVEMKDHFNEKYYNTMRVLKANNFDHIAKQNFEHLTNEVSQSTKLSQDGLKKAKVMTPSGRLTKHYRGGSNE